MKNAKHNFISKVEAGRRLGCDRETIYAAIGTGKLAVDSQGRIFDYAEAARKGTARRNLRMMAQVLAGKLITPPIYADEFTQWSRVLSELTQEEIIVMATYYKSLADAPGQDGTKILRALANTTAELMIKKLCRSEDDVRAILQSLGRYGLFLQQSTFGGINYMCTHRMSELMKLIRIEAVLAEPER